MNLAEGCPLNLSVSKQMYSFPKADRFGSNKRPVCAQFSYNISDTKTKRATGMGYGRRMQYLERKEAKPGPDQYNQNSMFRK